MFKGENVLAQYIQINLLTVQFPFYLILYCFFQKKEP